MTWYIEYRDIEQDREMQSRRFTHRQQAIDQACDLMRQKCNVHRIIGPGDQSIEQSQIERLFQERRRP